MARIPFLKSEEDRELFVNKVIRPFEEMIYEYKSNIGFKDHIKTLEEYNANPIERDWLLNRIEDFIDQYFHDRDVAPLSWQDPYLSKCEPDYERIDDKIVSGNIGRVRVNRNYKGSIVDWFSTDTFKELVKFKNNPKDKKVGNTIAVLTLLLGFNGWSNGDLGRRIYFLYHPFWTDEEKEKRKRLVQSNVTGYEDTSIYRELNRRSNELFRYIGEDKAFRDYLLGKEKFFPKDHKNKEPNEEESKYLFLFTEVAEFWEEVIINEPAFRPKTYRRWKKYRIDMYKNSAFIRFFFKENESYHSDQLLDELRNS